MTNPPNNQEKSNAPSIERQWSSEVKLFQSLLGQPYEQLPGDIQRNDKGKLDFVEGVVTEDALVRRLADVMKDRKIETYGELMGMLKDRQMLRSLQISADLERTDDKAEMLKLRRELLLSNQAATYYEYLPEVLLQIQQSVERYEQLRLLGRKLNLPLPSGFDVFEKNLASYLLTLRTAIDTRVKFANAGNLKDQLRLKEEYAARQKNAERLRALPKRTPQEERELSREMFDLSLTEKLGLPSLSMDVLRKQYEASLAHLADADRNVIEKGSAQDIAVRINSLQMGIVDTLSGNKKALGFEEDFVPHAAYVELWQQFDKNLLVVQKELERSIATTAPKDIESQRVFLRNARQNMSADMTAFVNDLGQYQLSLDEIARTQHHIGHSVSVMGVTPSLDVTSPKDAEALQEWLDVRMKHRQDVVRSTLVEADKMLEPGLNEHVEDAWAKDGQKMVADVAVRLSRIAAMARPAKGGVVMTVLDVTFNKAARLVGVPEIQSKEDTKDVLAGPILEALGWPKDKTWDELNAAEKKEVEKRTKSVLDAMKNFDRTKIANLRQSMDLVDALQAKNPVSAYANQEVDREILKAMEGKRITKDLTGENIGGRTVNGATAYILALRQRREDWGDPEKKTGFIGQYAIFLDALDENVKLHLDVGGALFAMQRAWWDYVKTTAALAVPAMLPFVIGGLTGTLPAAYRAGKFAVSRMYRTGKRAVRGSVNLAKGLSESNIVGKETKNALSKMRYLQRERDLVAYLEKSKVGRQIGKLKTVGRALLPAGSKGAQGVSKAARAGGVALKYGTAALIPAITAYELYQTRKRVANSGDNEKLKDVYKDGYKTALLEGTGYGAGLALGAGPQILFALPVYYAGNYRRERNEVGADWTRDIENWMKEYDSSGLMKKIRETNLTNAVESGGGGALYPRIAFPSSADQMKAASTIDKGQIGARAAIMEAYFKKNLVAPADASKETLDDMIRHKLTYVRDATQGAFDETQTYVYEQADIFTELMLRKKAMEKAGEPLLFSYYSADGDRQWIDLSKLGVSANDTGAVVRAYVAHVRPAEEVVLFETLGSLSRDNPVEFAKNTEAAKRMILSKLSHAIYKADSYIPDIDWPGVDLPVVSSGNSKAISLMRRYFALRVKSEVDDIVKELMEGNLEPNVYAERLQGVRNILVEISEARAGKKTDALYATARKYFQNPSAAEHTKGNPLIELLQEE